MNVSLSVCLLLFFLSFDGCVVWWIRNFNVILFDVFDFVGLKNICFCIYIFFLVNVYLVVLILFVKRLIFCFFMVGGMNVEMLILIFMSVCGVSVCLGMISFIIDFLD